ncbi:hypothetical protein J1N35_006864 [Gossypium stocksii]|uniref:Uncharacterized protein n=1 Tax=Gossypium stocksii TaxID=47602 RepID=A0A9D3W5K5_9ROSI|nr:hypothetical protein J1N35_006864 [Gossypium stocksii]
MARQDLIVVALVFITVVGAFATDKSPSPTPSKASSPARLPSSSSSASSTKSSSDGRAPKSSPVGAPKSFPNSSSPNIAKAIAPGLKKDPLLMLSHLAPAPFNSDATKAIIGIANIVVVTGFFLF